MDITAFSLIMLSAIMHAGWNFFTKKTTNNKISTLWVSWLIAGSIMTPISVLFTDINGISFSWVPYIILTAVIHAMYIYLLGWAYSLGEISVIYPISRGIGVFLTVIIVLLSGMEKISSKGVIGICMLVFGILMVSIKRIRDLEKRTAMLVAAMVGCCIAYYTIVDKVSITHIPPVFYISIMFLSSAALLAPLMLTRLRSQTRIVWAKHKLQCLMIGMVTLFGYLLILFALQTSPTPYVAALREISIVFGSILGIRILKEEKNKRKLAGIAIILLGAMVIKTA